MEEKNNKKNSLLVILLVLAIIVIIIMSYFVYNAYNGKDVENKNSVDKNMENLYIIKEIDISNADYSDSVFENDDNMLYNFMTKQWVNEIIGVEGNYYLAMDSEKNLYIVDRFENVLKKLDAKLEKLNMDDTNVDNFVTYVNVSKKQNALLIQTEDDSITFVVNLEDFSTNLMEFNDE